MTGQEQDRGTGPERKEAITFKCCNIEGRRGQKQKIYTTGAGQERTGDNRRGQEWTRKDRGGQERTGDDRRGQEWTRKDR
jgi:hypothetical protein